MLPSDEIPEDAEPSIPTLSVERLRNPKDRKRLFQWRKSMERYKKYKATWQEPHMRRFLRHGHRQTQNWIPVWRFWKSMHRRYPNLCGPEPWQMRHDKELSPRKIPHPMEGFDYNLVTALLLMAYMVGTYERNGWPVPQPFADAHKRLLDTVERAVVDWDTPASLEMLYRRLCKYRDSPGEIPRQVLWDAEKRFGLSCRWRWDSEKSWPMRVKRSRTPRFGTKQADSESEGQVPQSITEKE